MEAKDVELVVRRSRDEEFMELSDALQKRDLVAALKYVEDSLGQGTHPLQILGAVASIIRNLILARDRLHRLTGGSPPRTYGDFNSRVWPKLEHEAELDQIKLVHAFALFA